MAIAGNIKGQIFHCGVVLLMRQFAFNEPIGNGFSFRTGLKTFHSDTAKTILYRFDSQLPLCAINFLFGRSRHILQYPL